jgi:hypothetical protein
MVGNRPSFFVDLKVFFLRVCAHWREFKRGDLVVVLVTVGFGVLALNTSWWAPCGPVTVGLLAFWVVAAVVAFRLWRAEHAELLQARADLLDAEERLALRARLDVMYGLLEEGWRLEPLVLRLPTKSGWKAERLRGVLDRVGKPILDWQFRVRQELEASGLGAVAQWDGAADEIAGQPSPVAEPVEDTEEADLLKQLVQIRAGYFRRVPLLKNMVTTARG